MLNSLNLFAALGEHAWGELVAQSGERTEEFVIGVLFEQLANAAAILLELLLERDELPGDGDSQSALGGGHRRAAVELVGPRENLQTLLIGFGPLQAMLAEEFVPAFSPGSRQLLGRGELEDEGPGGRHGPVIERLARRGEVLVDRLLQLVDQRGALLDEGDLVATEVDPRRWAHFGSI